MRTLLFFILFVSGILAKGVEEYRPISACARYNKIEYRLLRSFRFQKSYYYLALNPHTLESHILDAKRVVASSCSQNYFHSRYYKLLDYSTAAPYPLQNDGITHGSRGLYLSVDLCPSSHRGYERRLFLALIAQPKHPFPVTLFITKRWILRHFKAFMELKEWQKKGLLDITWANHTAYHRYDKKSPLNYNFVLLPKEHLVNDILDLEVTLLNYGVIPSPFFRFPGLVSDRKSVEIVKRLGLIIIGSDSWLAKGQLPKEGSIILVQGNKNEPQGVVLLLQLLRHGVMKKFQRIEKIQ